MSQTAARSIPAANVSVLRLARSPALGALAAALCASLLLLGIRAIQAATGHGQTVAPIVPAVVLVTYAIAGAVAASVLFPVATPRTR